MDKALAEAFFWRHALPSLTKRLRTKGAGQVLADRRSLLRWRMTLLEAHMFADQLDAVDSQRDELLLQFDLQTMQRGGQGAGPAIESKLAFASACAQHGLPHAAARLLGPDRALSPALTLPLTLPLFIKPDTANRARGCALLVDNGGTYSLIRRDTVITGTSAQGLLAAHCPGETLLAQRVLTNHPDLAAWAGPGLLTLRIVTGIDAGAAQVLSTLAEISLDDERPLARRWAMLPVDAASGVLAAADPALPHCPDPHPLTGQRVSGQTIPHWQAARACAQTAHMLIAPQLKMVGWDVAITPEGPVLIEGNANWAVATHCCNSAGFDLAPARRFARFANGTAP